MIPFTLFIIKLEEPQVIQKRANESFLLNSIALQAL